METDDIKKRNISICLINIGEFVDTQTQKLDEFKLVETVKNHDPSTISLAFCYTNISILNDILRSKGIYSKLIISQDRFKITNVGVLTLDKEQTDIIEEISKHKYDNVILWGSHGTGKTLLLVEALGIKTSHYKIQNVRMKVLISSYINNSCDSALMKDLKNYYLAHFMHEDYVEFTDFPHLCEGI